MQQMRRVLPILGLLVLVGVPFSGFADETGEKTGQFSAKQLERWRLRFPRADRNGDGVLTAAEAQAYRRELRSRSGAGRNRGGGAPMRFEVDPGWDESDFPENALSRKSPDEIAAVYAGVATRGPAVTSFPEPEGRVMRIVGTGHSFMTPGYRTLPLICRAAGFEQPLLTHIGGGITGSARYKWEQENGIFDFAGKPHPKLLASIANAEWEAMMWGPYFHDRPEYYTCWIEFCRRFHPEMKFYLSDSWPQLYQLGQKPETESVFTEALFERIGAEKNEIYATLVGEIRRRTVEQVYILPTSDAMTIAAKRYLRGELPGVEGVNTVIGKKERSLWRDQLGHLGPGFERLEGYVFYATLYGESPERIEEEIVFRGSSGYPGPELDRAFREIAWEAVTGHPLSGVVDMDGDGMADPGPVAE